MNKYTILYVIALSLFISMPSYGQVISKFGKKEVEIADWVDTNFKKGKLPPFSFIYDSEHSGSFIRKWKFSSLKLGEIEKGVMNNIYTWQDEKTKMTVDCDVKYYPEYKAVEWVLRFTNGSTGNSLTIEQVKVIDIDFQYTSNSEIILHYAEGSSASRADFHPRKKILAGGESFEIFPCDGRSSDHAFPFFNVESTSGQGAMFAIGWSGTWYSQFEKRSGNAISFNAGMKSLNTYLNGNESIRTPSICLLFWNDGDRMIGHNAFRRFMINQQTPKINGKPAVYPISTSFNYGDPYPCNEYTCMTTDYALAMINRYKKFKLVPEVFWLDAGWYTKANEIENNKNWANTVGNWEVDKNRFPDGLKPISDAVHDAGAKFMLWFEPERVMKDSKWGTEHRKWMLDAKGTDAYLFDLGNKEALSWLCNYVGDFMAENGIDYYRQDFNMRIDNYWRENDEPGRTGMREIRHIEGLYAFWDYLLKRFPESIVDNCASGGRRLDFESMKRSAPMWRTDYNYGEPVGYQTHTYGLNFFLPLTGTGVDKNDKFTFRSSLGTSVVFNWKITEASSSFIEMQRCFREFMDIRPYFYEDYYPLTSYEDMTTDDIWLAYQLHRPSDGTGIIVAFRRDQSPDETLTVRLSAVDPEKTYTVTNSDTGESFVKTGNELRNGLQLILKETRSSLIYSYAELKKEKTALSILQLNLWVECTKVDDATAYLSEQIAYLNPDIATFCELFRNDVDNPLLPQLIGDLNNKGLEYYSARIDGRAVISKYPITETERVNEWMFKAVLDINGKRVAVYPAHSEYRYYTCYYPRGYNDGSIDWKKLPDPVTDIDEILLVSRKSGRIKSVQTFINNAETEIKKGALVFLSGDLNEPSHLDWGEETKDLYDHRGCIVHWDVSRLLYGNGFKDAYREVHPDAVNYPGFTFPADNADAGIEVLTWAPDADERERIDFIYYYPSEKLRITDAKIFGPVGSIVRSERQEEKTKDTFITPVNGNWPSDHKGVVATFTIEE